MAVPKRKWSKARTRNKRANYKISAPGLVDCPQCHKLMMTHRVCKACGYYKSKEVVKVD